MYIFFSSGSEVSFALWAYILTAFCSKLMAAVMANDGDRIPTILPNEISSSEARQNWARLIQQIYEVDPLVCPKCQGQMKIISIIDDFEIIDKILRVTFRL